MRLDEYVTRFEYIQGMEIGQGKKDKMLSGLMSDLERNFQIPAMKNETWEQENPKVYTLYREIADSRSL